VVVVSRWSWLVLIVALVIVALVFLGWVYMHPSTEIILQ
jgi:hypothetical protein